MHPTLIRTLRWFGLLEAGRRVELRLRLRDARALPDALIIGAMKSGTSSLHYYLTQQPQVIAPLRKEVHYFDLNFGRGESWYRANFGREGQDGVNIDSSPYYLFHPQAPQRAHALVPHAKLIVLLRDPVRRAYSHYWHERDKGREPLAFEDAIAAEPDRIDRVHERLARGEIERSAAHQYFSYLARGRYAEQLERWLQYYPREQLLVLRFEDLARNPLPQANAALAHVGLSPLGEAQLGPRNTRKYPPLDPATAERLRDYFVPHDAALAKVLGRPVRW
ncbi:MAG: sulfotransferase domain-containing protein [Gammaproteobacteria bacterium]|nr:sulfotransferase domain-containing protein [Gammaproteobacteria bacterium]MDH4312314.1 sulfotransferase domain-containing protein [Gammaproteobacteria bacterium]